MMTNLFNVKIVGITGAVSNTWTPISSFSNIDQNTITKFTKTTGVVGRYDSPTKQTTSDLCFAAASQLIKAKKIDKNNIKVLVLVTQTPDYKSPASACVLHGRLGLNEDCLAFDINLGCSGFTSALAVIGSLLSNCLRERNTPPPQQSIALLLCGDTTAKGRLNYPNSHTSNAAKMLLGDCGTATLLRYDETSAMTIKTYTRGSGYKAIISPYMGFRHPVPYDDGAGEDRMNDIEVFNFSTEEAPKAIKEMMQYCHTTPEDYNCLALHQANLMIMKRIAKLSGFKEEKMLISIDKFGNTASASIPISFVKSYGDVDNNAKLKCLLCGYGVGLSWSVVDCCISTDDIFPLIQTDDFFDDGFYKE